MCCFGAGPGQQGVFRTFSKFCAARVAVFVLAGLAFLLSFTSQEFFDVALFAYTIYGVGITPALLAALFWKRATPAGAITGMVSAVTLAVIWKIGELGRWSAEVLDLPAGAEICYFSKNVM